MRTRAALRLGPAVLAVLLAAACRREAPPAVRGSADQLRPEAEWLQQEPVALLRDYLRLDTRPAKGEKAGAEFLGRLLECDGIETEIVCPAPGRCNLLARLPGRRREGALLLLNHIDVVDVAEGLWKEARPFDGAIRNGYLYGRGAYDMKSLGIAQALALREIRRRGVVPRTDILFLAEADEEAGQRWGSAWLLAHRPEWFRGVAAVLNEGGSNEMILRDIRFWGIETVQAGYGLVDLANPAREPLAAIAAAWPKLSAPSVEPLPVIVEAFGMLANHLGHPLTDPLRHLDRVRTHPEELAALPDRYGAFLEPRLFWFGPYAAGGTGGFREIAVVSTPPGVAPDPFVARIVADAGNRKLTVRETFSTGATVASPYPTPFTEMIRRITEARYPSVPFGPAPTFGGVTTSIHFRRHGMDAYGYSPIPMNITDTARRHGNDERIYLRDYLEGVRLYREIVAEHALTPVK